MWWISKELEARLGKSFISPDFDHKQESCLEAVSFPQLSGEFK